MRTAVITFPGSNCDRDMATALTQITGKTPLRVWHKETELPDVDLVALPGGFSFGDYLRCGAMSARSPIIEAVKRAAERGTYILGVCNGFQILCETGLLPGVLMRNAGLDFICEDTALETVHTGSPFSKQIPRRALTIPVAHHDGNYFADTETLDRLEGEGQILFRYKNDINGAQRRIAGIVNARGNILGMMPHPERACDAATGLTDGSYLFRSLMDHIG